MAAPALNTKYYTDPDAHGWGKNQRVFRVPVGTDPVKNGLYLIDMFNFAQSLGPTADNWVVIVCPPGEYDLGSDSIGMGANYVAIVGYGSARYNPVTGLYTKPESYIHTGNGQSSCIQITAQTVRLERLRVEVDADAFAAATPIEINNSNGANGSSFIDIYAESQLNSNGITTYPGGTGQQTISAYFENCHSPDSMIRCHTFSGVARNCSGGIRSFASGVSGTGLGVTFSGEAYDCVAGLQSFGFAPSNPSCTFSGRAERCKSAEDSFGAAVTAPVTFSGTVIDCEGGVRCFGYSLNDDATFSGTAKRCIAADYSFGSTGTPATKGGIVSGGLFVQCEGGHYSFGGSDTPIGNDQFLAEAIDCNGRDNCFAPRGDFGGQCTRCSASGYAFGGTGGTSTDGKLIDCSGFNLLGPIDLRDGFEVRRGYYRGDATATAAPFIVSASTTTPPKMTYVQIEAADAVSYSVDSSGTQDIKMAQCAMNKDIDTNLTNLIGPAGNVVDSDLK